MNELNELQRAFWRRLLERPEAYRLSDGVWPQRILLLCLKWLEKYRQEAIEGVDEDRLVEAMDCVLNIVECMEGLEAMWNVRAELFEEFVEARRGEG